MTKCYCATAPKPPCYECWAYKKGEKMENQAQVYGSGEQTPKKNAEFATHKLNPIGMDKAKSIASAFDHLLNTLTYLCTDGRYLALTKTKLEEAAFFAKKAMAVNLDNQEQ